MGADASPVLPSAAVPYREMERMKPETTLMWCV